MPLAPLPHQFDPRAPTNHGAPILWLRHHFRRWAFHRRATDAQIDRYLIWLHIYREAAQLRERERVLRPPLSFRLRLLVHRLGFADHAADGVLPSDALQERDMRAWDQQRHG